MNKSPRINQNIRIGITDHKNKNNTTRGIVGLFIGSIMGVLLCCGCELKSYTYSPETGNLRVDITRLFMDMEMKNFYAETPQGAIVEFGDMSEKIKVDGLLRSFMMGQLLAREDVTLEQVMKLMEGGGQ